MEIEIDLSKTIEENSTHYFQQSKLARRKIEGIKKAIVAQNLEQMKKEKVKEKAIERKRKWFEKFRWFYTSNNFLVVGGKDAHLNEELVKKHMDKRDIYFHAEVFGAPHCVIKLAETKKNAVDDVSMSEAAEFAVTFSKAWEEGRAQADAYSVKPEQVSKTAQPGEHLGTGAFMIYGERNWFKKAKLTCAIGFFEKEKTLMCGPVSAIKKHCKFVIELKQGSKSKEEVGKELKQIFESKGCFFSVDNFVSLLPNGNFSF